MVDEKDEPHDFVPRRIVVALESAAASISALESAVQLAAVLEAELEGLFVEDVDLLRLSELPTSSEVHWSSAVLAPIDALAVQRAFRVQAQRMRRMLEQSARRARVACSFQTTRGRLSQIVWSATQADVMVLGRARRFEAGRRAVSPETGPPVAVFVDETASSAHALAAGVRICRGSGAHLLVYVWADDPEKAAHLRREAARRLQPAEVRAALRILENPTPEKLYQIVKSAQAVPILGVDQTLLSRRDLARFVDLVNVLLLVR